MNEDENEMHTDKENSIDKPNENAEEKEYGTNENRRYNPKREQNTLNEFKRNVVLGARNFLIIVVILIVVFVIVGEFVEYIRVFHTFNVIEKIDYAYEGEFTIISPEIDSEQNVNPNGAYIISNNKGITFNAYKDNTSLKTDYDMHLLKSYVTEYKKSTGTDIVCNETYSNWKGTNFLEFKFGMNASTYYDLPKVIDKLYNLNQYIIKQSKKDYAEGYAAYNCEVYINDAVLTFDQNDFVKDLNYCITKSKIEYVNYLHKSNLNDENVPENDMVTFHRPDKLKIYINGEASETVNRSIFGKSIYDNNARYYIEKGEYELYLFDIIDEIDVIDRYNRLSTGKLMTMTYKGKVYNFTNDLDGKQKIDGDNVPHLWGEKLLKEFFGAEIKIDYENESIYLTFE